MGPRSHNPGTCGHTLTMVNVNSNQYNVCTKYEWRFPDKLNIDLERSSVFTHLYIKRSNVIWLFRKFAYRNEFALSSIYTLPSQMSAGHFTWTRPYPTRPGETLTRSAKIPQNRDPTRPDPRVHPTRGQLWLPCDITISPRDSR